MEFRVIIGLLRGKRRWGGIENEVNFPAIARGQQERGTQQRLIVTLNPELMNRVGYTQSQFGFVQRNRPDVLKPALEGILADLGLERC